MAMRYLSIDLGSSFIEPVLGPSPWTRLLASASSDASPDGPATWFKTGACVVGRELIKDDFPDAGDFDGHTRHADSI